MAGPATCSWPARSVRSRRPSTAPSARRAATIRAAFREQVEGLLEGGVDLLLFETVQRPRRAAARRSTEARALSDLPIVAQMTFGEDLLAVDGTSPQTAATRAGRGGRRRARRQLRRRPVDLPRCADADGPAVGRAGRCSIMPNAGLPHARRGPVRVRRRAGLLRARRCRASLDAGARIIGGCCGTTPEHIAAHAPGARHASCARARGTAAATAPTPGRERRRLAAVADRRAAGGGAAARKRRHPPASPACSPRAASSSASRSTRRGRCASSARSRPARLLQEAGVDLVNISDSAMARVRMGAHGRRVRHPARPRPRVPGPLHDARPQPDGARVGAAGRARARRAQHPGADRRPATRRRLPDRARASGTSIRRASSASSAASTGARTRRASPSARRPGFTVACALDPTADDLEHEIDRLAGKLDAGADLIMTQPIYAREQWDRFMERAVAALGRPAAAAGAAGRPAAAHSPPRRVPAQRGARHHHPRRGPRRDGRGRRARRRGRAGDGACELLDEHARAGPGHVHHAQLRPLRAERGARAPAPGDRAGAAGRRDPDTPERIAPTEASDGHGAVAPAAATLSA